METVYFKGEVSPYGWAKVPAYPPLRGRLFLAPCPRNAPALN
jgi:hypothetical protein